jgi:hypothetical protein
VFDFSGERDLARSVDLAHQQTSHTRAGTGALPLPGLTCSPRQALAAALDDILLELAHALGVLLVALLSQLADSRYEFSGIELVVGGHDGRKHDGPP